MTVAFSTSPPILHALCPLSAEGEPVTVPAWSFSSGERVDVGPGTADPARGPGGRMGGQRLDGDVVHTDAARRVEGSRVQRAQLVLQRGNEVVPKHRLKVPALRPVVDPHDVHVRQAVLLGARPLLVVLSKEAVRKVLRDAGVECVVQAGAVGAGHDVVAAAVE